eukprot:scaffold12372_cov101-Isochrysis_galbana.AAC.1
MGRGWQAQGQWSTGEACARPRWRTPAQSRAVRAGRARTLGCLGGGDTGYGGDIDIKKKKVRVRACSADAQHKKRHLW